MPDWHLAEADPAGAEAQACLARYYAELDARFPEGFRVEHSHDPDAALLRRPHGAFIISFAGASAVGCVALKGTCPAYGEIKRLWVDPAWRGRGLSRALMTAAEDIARELGITTLRLDTHSVLTDAIAMYRRWGWHEIDPFNDDPYAHLFFEKAI